MRGLPDEVALLRARLDGRAQFGVGKDRYATGLALARDGADWFILDDGFQHLALQRDADIVLLDATDPFGGGGFFRPGACESRVRPWRAPMSWSSRAPATLRRWKWLVRRFTKAPIFYAQAELDAVLRAPAMRVAAPESDGGEPSILRFAASAIRWPSSMTCGIGAFRSWASAASPIIIVIPPRKCGRLDAAAAAGADALVCTEKDVFNLDSARHGASHLRLPDSIGAQRRRGLLEGGQGRCWPQAAVTQA